jgi:DNA-binding LytR/AlgR family response regulator
MKVLIIEDESIAAQRLQNMLRELDREIEVVNILDSVESTVAYFQQARTPELEAALLKFKKNYPVKISAHEPEKAKTRFLAKSGTRLLSVPIENIAYFYTKEKLQYIKTTNNEELLFDKRLEEIEAEVDDSIFFRANRQFIVNYTSIEKVHCWFNGKLKVQLTPSPYEEVIISRLKSAEFKKWLGE